MSSLCSRPTCGSDPLSGLISHSESPGDSDSSPEESRLFLTGRCVIVTHLEAGTPNLNISLWPDNSLNIAKDTDDACGTERRPTRCRRLRSATRHADLSLYSEEFSRRWSIYFVVLNLQSLV